MGIGAVLRYVGTSSGAKSLIILKLSPLTTIFEEPNQKQKRISKKFLNKKEFLVLLKPPPTTRLTLLPPGSHRKEEHLYTFMQPR